MLKYNFSKFLILSFQYWCFNYQKKGEYIQWSLEKELGCQNDKWNNDPLNDARNIAANYIMFTYMSKK